PPRSTFAKRPPVQRLQDLSRQLDGERRFDVGLARQRDGPAVRLDDLPHDPQPQPQAAVVTLADSALEPSEDALLIGRPDADATVAHQEARRALARHLDGDRLAGTI